MATTSRLLSSGSLLVNGECDEETSISPATFRTTSTAVYAAQLDEISFVPGSWTLSGSQGVTVGNSSVFALPGDFTVEFFFYLSSVPSTEIDFWESQTNTTFRILKRGSSSGLSYDAYGGTSYLIVADASIPTNAWNHVAVSRTGTTVQAYFNGTRTINQTDATSFGAPTANYSVGCRTGGTNSLTGSISNFRLVKGAGMYTGATIPVPSAPLGAVSGTQLLLPTPYTGGAFFDYSTNNFTVTKVGAPVSGSGDPFTVNTPQRLTSTGILQVANDFDEVSLTAGAIAFSGSGTTTTFPSINTPASTSLNLYTANSTVECWFNLTSYSTGSNPTADSTVFSFYSGSAATYYAVKISNTGFLKIAKDGSGAASITSTTAIALNTWYHFAWIHTANTTTNVFYINGINVTGTFSDPSLGGAFPLNPASSTLYIGATYYNNTPYTYIDPWIGYISNFRVVQGTQVYTAPFTPPQSVLPSITNTQLLLNVIDSANFITDNSPNAFTVTNNNTATWSATGPFNS